MPSGLNCWDNLGGYLFGLASNGKINSHQ